MDLDAYVAAGGNFIDSADVYSKWIPGSEGGDSERMLGEWLRLGGAPDDLVIATKVGNGAEDVPRGLGRAQIHAGCDASLRRLGVERIELYYAHRDDPGTPLEETMAAFDELVQWLLPVWRTPMGFTKDQLRAIQAPTLVADGDHDEVIVLEQIEEMSKLIPHAQLAVFTDASHFALWQDPEDFNKTLLDFLAK